jgi:hypothetical protein
MSTWMLVVVLLGLIKLPIAGLLLWLPFREDESMRAVERGPSEEDGGSRALPASPTDPRPRRPIGGRRPPRRPGGDRAAASGRRRDPHPPPLVGRRVRAPARGRR